jgi:hypothetical protein
MTQPVAEQTDLEAVEALADDFDAATLAKGLITRLDKDAGGASKFGVAATIERLFTAAGMSPTPSPALMQRTVQPFWASHTPVTLAAAVVRRLIAEGHAELAAAVAAVPGIGLPEAQGSSSR